MTSIQSGFRFAPLALFAAMVLAGCATSAPIDSSSLPSAPIAFKEAAATNSAVAIAQSQSQGTWWKVFSDPALDQLMDKADRNSSVMVAAGRLRQARAILRSVDADRSPQVGASVGASRVRDVTTGNVPTTVVSAGLGLSYEVDLLGKLSLNSDAASLDAQSREALLRSTKLMVQADVAQTYLNLRALDAERVLVRDTLSAYRNTLRLTESRFKEGDVAELDVARVRTEVATTESDAFALDRRRAELEHALAVLIGEVASNFQIAQADWITALPSIPAGVPSTVLERRPDVSAAEISMRASAARVGVAKAAWFPTVALTANGGYAAPDIEHLFATATRAWGIGALLSLPIFDGGRRDAGIESSNAELDIALANYREQILVAFRDVEDQLSALRILADQSDAQSRSVNSATRATLLSDSRYRNGFVSQLELLDAQRSELSSRRRALQVKNAQYLATVGLIRALGGGWSV